VDKLFNKEDEEAKGRFARYILANVAQAWEAANGEQRNKLARCLLQEVWVKDKRVVAVTPRPEFERFFRHGI